jgi:hypothetical protein
VRFRGENRAVPTKEEFTIQFNEATERIKKYLPKAKIIEYADAHFDAAYEMLRHLSERYEAECEFLLSVAPIIFPRKKDADLKKAHSEIVSNCERFGLRKTSLILICTLSCLYERNDGEEPLIGRKIINPNESYSKKMLTTQYLIYER